MKFSFPSFKKALWLPAAFACALPALAQAQATKVNEQNLYHYWILLNTSVQMNAPNSGLNLEKPGCVAVTYTVGSNGLPLNVQVAKVVPKSDLGQVAKSAVSNFRYGPSLTNRVGQPVSTYYIVPFNAPDDKTQREQLIANCKLSGYGA